MREFIDKVKSDLARCTVAAPKSDTPRTDEVMKQIYFDLEDRYPELISFSRQLERELAEEKVWAERCKKAWDFCHLQALENGSKLIAARNEIQRLKDTIEAMV